MVLEYFTKKGKKTAPPAVATTTAPAPKEEIKSPVLTPADEDFLRRITEEAHSPLDKQVVIVDKDAPSTDAQTRLMDDADKIPLPMSPPEAEVSNPIDREIVEDSKPDPKAKKERRKSAYISYIQKHLPFGKERSREQAGSDLQDVATAVKDGKSLAPPIVVVSEDEAAKEKSDITGILDQLNLSAVNNRAFSVSKESQKLFDEFTQILKDLINGVPTAYDDLEKLLTNKDKELRGMFDNLPPFLQKFVATLPTKFSASSIAPGILAAAAQKPDESVSSASKASRLAQIPVLKNLVKTDAVVGLLRGILNFLKLRFPALLGGTNVLISLAVFLLLFVFWYCHKRGKETRLEKEKLAAGGQDANSDLESVSDMDEIDAARVQEALARPPPSQVALPENADKKHTQ